MTIEMVKYGFIGPHIDVPGPEKGSTRHHMDYIKDIYQTIYGNKDINAQAIVTGKSDVNGGLKNYYVGAGAGIYYSITMLYNNKHFKDIR